MTTEIERIVLGAEVLIKKSDEQAVKAQRVSIHTEVSQLDYSFAIYFGIRALYEQNRVIIELLGKGK